jgi:multiple sugar transport system permease protein
MEIQDDKIIPSWNAPTMKKIHRALNPFLLNLTAILICIFFLFPIFWLVSNSLKLDSEVFKSPPTLFPDTLYFDSYIAQFNPRYNTLIAFRNSMIISLCSMFISIALSTPAAYGLARYKLKGRRLIILTFLITQMLPATLILTPLFIMFNKMNILNNLISPIIADATLGIPFSILILRTFFLGIPKELDESAKVDGCNSFMSFFRIILPITFPGLMVVSIFSFLFAWGDLIFSLTFLNSQILRPLTAGIYNFISYYGLQWNKIMAYGMITIIPVLLIFIFMQKHIISGLTAGAVKA